MVERRGHVWFVRGYAVAQQVLRARHATTQAGFTSEYIPAWVFTRRPILINDGPEHDRQRRELARFLAPAVVMRRHLARIERCAADLVSPMADDDVVNLDRLALHYAVEVTAQVVGLDLSHADEPVIRRRRRIARTAARLEGFFTQPPFDITRPGGGRTSSQWAAAAARGLWPLLRFHLADVRPAVAARRRTPADDIVSRLIATGASNADILAECVTYGTAGMVTTREFITMAAWRLLDDASLGHRYLASGREDRYALLEEIIRVEPVVGHLYRRAVAPVELHDGHRRWTVPAGDVIDVCVRAANVDPVMLGPEPFAVCPERVRAEGVSGAGLAFGDGAHKCPGQSLAVVQTEVLLTALLARRPVVLREPDLGWDDVIAGYRLRGMRLGLTTSPQRRSATA